MLAIAIGCFVLAVAVGLAAGFALLESWARRWACKAGRCGGSGCWCGEND